MKAIYNSKDWVLCACLKCGRLNYIEPHGTTGQCKCSSGWAEHVNLPYTGRDSTGTVWLGPNRVKIQNGEVSGLGGNGQDEL
jgi:hypothetical protein